MRRLTLDIPESVGLDERELVLFLAAKLYESGKLTLGQAADLVGLTKPTFAELLGKYGICLFNYPASGIDEDVLRA